MCFYNKHWDTFEILLQIEIINTQENETEKCFFFKKCFGSKIPPVCEYMFVITIPANEIIIKSKCEKKKNYDENMEMTMGNGQWTLCNTY